MTALSGATSIGRSVSATALLAPVKEHSVVAKIKSCGPSREP